MYAVCVLHTGRSESPRTMLDEAGEPWGATRGPQGRRGQPPDGSDGHGDRHAGTPGRVKGFKAYAARGSWYSSQLRAVDEYNL